MSNPIKEEIRRIARREANALTKRLRQDNAGLKKSNADLKRRVAKLEKIAARHQEASLAWKKQALKASPEDLEGLRFRKDTVSSIRKRLKLTQAELAKLAGVSLATVGNWEKESIPKDEHKATLAGLRKLGRKQAREMLEGMS